MKNTWILFLLLAPMPSIWSFQSSDCSDAPTLSDDRIKEIIASERAKHKDILGPFPPYDTIIRRDGCYYTYIENRLDARAFPKERLVIVDSSIIFKLNKDGAIVDMPTRSIARPDQDQKTPSWCSEEKVFSETELAEIVARARAKRSDLPALFPKSRVRVQRKGCVYRYWEYALPETLGNFQVFSIDRFGELMEIMSPHPF
jgi:hypothetical protein